MDNLQSKVAKHISSMQISAIKDMAIRSAKVPGVASLTWGLPSFNTPEHIRRAVNQHLDNDPDIGKYTLPDGLPELREMVAAHHRHETGLEVDPQQHVMITAGNMQGVNSVLHALVEPGDEVIVTDPGFASHAQQIRLCGGAPVYWAMSESQGWRLNLDTLSDLITDKTKAVILVTPSNPTGAIFPEGAMRHIGQVALDKGVFLIVDDPYHYFTYENKQTYFNLASVEVFFSNTAYLFTFSKTHAMSGWRLGYMIVPPFMKREIIKVHDATMICAPRVSQVAGMAALSAEPLHIQTFESTLAKRRQLICERLDRVPHVFQYHRPEGAYYVFPKIVTEHADSFAFSLDLLETAKVTVTPGRAFGPSGEHHVRLAYCVDEDTINLAFDRIEQRFAS